MLYEYECQTCRDIIEVFQHISDEAFDRVFCPTCGKEQIVRKVISAPTFFLKGGGWAKDGYAKGGNKHIKDTICKTNN